MSSSLRILLLEDDSRDAELIQELLEGENFVCEITLVQTRAGFLTALEHDGIDLILADYKLPSFDGVSALKLASSGRPDVPFIFVSGTIGEELAIEALKMGATDYVLKTGLSRLVPSVRRTMREAEGRAERKKAEEALCRSEGLSRGSATADPHGQFRLERLERANLLVRRDISNF
jgi:DNA-binding response OmpR family regulator